MFRLWGPPQCPSFQGPPAAGVCGTLRPKRRSEPRPVGHGRRPNRDRGAHPPPARRPILIDTCGATGSVPCRLLGLPPLFVRARRRTALGARRSEEAGGGGRPTRRLLGSKEEESKKEAAAPLGRDGRGGGAHTYTAGSSTHDGDVQWGCLAWGVAVEGISVAASVGGVVRAACSDRPTKIWRRGTSPAAALLLLLIGTHSTIRPTQTHNRITTHHTHSTAS